MNKLEILALLSCAALGACGAGKTAGALHSTAVANGGAQNPSETRMLCLAAIDGTSAVDKALTSAQSAAGAKNASAKVWVEVGRQWVRRARLVSDPGFYLNVEACAAEALLIDPDFDQALSLRSLVLMNDHRFEQARALAEQILVKDPENVIALGTLSDALLELGRYAQAAAAAQRQMHAHPGMAAHSRGSYLRWIQGDSKSAKLLIRDALLDRNPADPEPAAWVFVEAGNIYWQEADYAGADALFAEALNWVADQPAALIGRARIALSKNDPASAIGFLQRAHRVRPAVESAWLLSDASQLQGDDGAAQGWADEAIRQGRRGDKLNLALFLSSRDLDASEALRLIEEERRTRGGVYIDDAYAWALYRAGRIDEARAASARAMQMGTRDARLLYHAGAIELAAGNIDRGRQQLTAALALNPGFDRTGAAHARSLLSAALPAVAANKP